MVSVVGGCTGVALMGYDTIDRNKFLGKSGLYDLNPSLNTAPRNDTIMTLSELFHQHFSHVGAQD